MAKKFNSKEEVLSYVNSLSLQEIVSQLVDKIWEETNEKSGFSKISLTEEQMTGILSLFKIKGMTENGEIERRGRKKSL